MSRIVVRRLCSIAAVSAAAFAPIALATPARAAGLTCSAVGQTLTVEAANFAGNERWSVAGGLLTLHDDSAAPSGISCSVPVSTVNTININADTFFDDWVVDLSSAWTGADGTNVLLDLPVDQNDSVRFDGSTGTNDQVLKYVGTGTPLRFDTDGDGTADVSFDGQFNGFRGSVSAPAVRTGSGDDTIDLTGAVPNNTFLTQIDSGAGDDTVTGTAAFDDIFGGDGNDTVNGGAGTDTVNGGPGDDHVYGGDGSDVIQDADGADTLDGDNPATTDSFGDTIHVFFDFAKDEIGHLGDTSDTAVFFGGLDVHASLDGVPNDGALTDGLTGEDDLVGAGDVQTFEGADVIDAAGFSSVDTGAGNDSLVLPTHYRNGIAWAAGDGSDTLDASGFNGFLRGDFGNSGSMLTTQGSDGFGGHIDGSGFENIVGGTGSDDLSARDTATVRPGPGNDKIHFSAGGTYVANAGADGKDTVTVDGSAPVTADYSTRASAVSLTIDGDANDGSVGEGDSLDFGVTTLLGGHAGDILAGSAASDVLSGGDGNDQLLGRGGADAISGGTGSDSLFGGSGDDLLLGQGGADRLVGGDGDDTLRGDDRTDVATFGNDSLDGGNGDDDEFGFGGNDTFAEGASANGSDLLAGGSGTDTASYAARSVALKLSLNGRYDDGTVGEGDRIGTDVENLTGGRGADLLVGGPTANLLVGGAGNDNFQTVLGGVDTLNGGAGTDKAHRDTSDKVTSVEKRY